MRSQVGKALRNQFEERLRKEYPDFVRIPGRVPSGWRLYMWRVSDKLAFYVQLEVFDKYDDFNLTVGFGEPGVSPRPYNPVTPESSVHQPGKFRLSHLFPGPYRDRTLELDPGTHEFPLPRPDAPIEETIARIPGALDEAFERLAKYAMPYFETVSKWQGHELAPALNRK